MADTVIVNGLPRGVVSQQLEQFFDAHGTVLSATVAPFSSHGVVRFADSKSVDDLLRKTLEMEGSTLSLKRMNGMGAAQPLMQKDPAKPLDTPMDTVIVRGFCTKTALGSIASLAKGKATVMVLLDRPCAKQQDSGIVGALRKREYKHCVEEEEPDKMVRDKALMKFGAHAQRCALVHFVSDQLRSAGGLSDPLWHADDILNMQAENHTQSMMVSFAAAIYAKWIHTFRAGLFIVLPHNLEAFGSDLGTCNVTVHRAVATDSLRIENKNWSQRNSQTESKTSGFTYGIQLPDGDVTRNVVNICKAITSIAAVSDLQAEDLSGRPIALG